MKNRITGSSITLEIAYLSIGDYVACVYDKNCYVGLV